MMPPVTPLIVEPAAAQGAARPAEDSTDAFSGTLREQLPAPDAAPDAPPEATPGAAGPEPVPAAARPESLPGALPAPASDAAAVEVPPAMVAAAVPGAPGALSAPPTAAVPTAPQTLAGPAAPQTPAAPIDAPPAARAGTPQPPSTILAGTAVPQVDEAMPPAASAPDASSAPRPVEPARVPAPPLQASAPPLSVPGERPDVAGPGTRPVGGSAAMTVTAVPAAGAHPAPGPVAAREVGIVAARASSPAAGMTPETVDHALPMSVARPAPAAPPTAAQTQPAPAVPATPAPLPPAASSPLPPADTAPRASAAVVSPVGRALMGEPTPSVREETSTPRSAGAPAGAMQTAAALTGPATRVQGATPAASAGTVAPNVGMTIAAGEPAPPAVEALTTTRPASGNDGAGRGQDVAAAVANALPRATPVAGGPVTAPLASAVRAPAVEALPAIEVAAALQGQRTAVPEALAAAGALTAPSPGAAGETLSGTAPASPRAFDAVNIPVSQPGWANALAARVSAGVAPGVQRASIALNPEALGPLSLTVTLNEDEASVSFVSSHAVVRDAVEAALPRLREMLASQGINLVDVNVSSGDGSPRGDVREDARPDSSAARDAARGESESPRADDARPATDSLVDTFA